MSGSGTSSQLDNPKGNEKNTQHSYNTPSILQRSSLIVPSVNTEDVNSITANKGYPPAPKLLIIGTPEKNSVIKLPNKVFHIRPKFYANYPQIVSDKILRNEIRLSQVEEVVINTGTQEEIAHLLWSCQFVRELKINAPTFDFSIEALPFHYLTTLNCSISNHPCIPSVKKVKFFVSGSDESKAFEAERFATHVKENVGRVRLSC